ncbi:alkanesulfonate monooxygenase SsuD/methylene tetrahydromethanopterin reductase-like flavin-dependent oxidoreductase (luciferase family) [Streptosporangium album]|uniref:Alkanesulfonate monooxygenase SsuD/methylene tetrahydromethanopterin reductase-like flavin-dependent oxidoreductase (Luciferase family) n=1 Tax=Streptosporangium album TaxID=47479 RepID=A0A7W7S5P2_9ACTN|nr:LLM class flavin-dependent oxidoreductase [Streptosporangium album]MBB4944162.1 alkanesulfonate monooxygenase SsuD/methylene tetrahydromethanopterin reductase-like flavin-dependent oxidoreductase (luciferase family) [Streptosporangium album]
MRVGIGMHFSNSGDWDRFEARERGENVPGLPEIPDSKILQDDLRIAELTEELGYDALWSVEHHVTPYQMAPNPLQFLTYMAGRTSRIDLGTMVTVLPWHQPVRLAEQIAFLQEVMGEERSLRLGVGRGIGRREYQAYGVDMEESRPRFQEALDIVRLALTKDRFSYDGQIFKIPETELRPHPQNGQRIVDNMCCAWGSPQSVAVAAANGLKALVIPNKPVDEYATELTEYAKIRAENGFAPTRPTLVLWAYCDENQQRASEVADRYMRRYVDSAYRHYEFFGTHFDKLASYSHYAERAARVRGSQTTEEANYLVSDHIWGTPDQCVAKVRDMVGRTNCDEIILHVSYGGMPLDDAERSMRLIAKEVLPTLKEL